MRDAIGAIEWVLASAGWLGALGVLSALLNAVFWIVVARRVGPADFSEAAPLLYGLTIVALIGAGTEYTVARVASLHEGPPREALRLGFGAAWPWLALTAIGLPIAPLVSAVLGLSSAGPVLVTTGGAGALMSMSVAMGLLSGRGHHVAVGLLQFASAAGRLAFVLLLVRGPDPLTGAVIAAAAPLGAVAVLSVGAAWLGLRSSPAATLDRAVRFDDVGGAGASGALLAGSLWVIWGIPLLLSRHALPPVVAGDFAAAHFSVGLLIWTSGVFIKALQPTLVRRQSVRMAAFGALVTVALCTAGGAALLVGGSTVIRTLFGGAFTVDPLVVLALVGAATAVAVALYALWASKAIRRGALLAAIAIAVAVPAEALVALVIHGGAPQVAVGPVIAAALGATGGLVARRVAGRRIPSMTAAWDAITAAVATGGSADAEAPS